MHAILSKVFGRKKAEDKDGRKDKDARKAKRSSTSGTLLEGKFEAVLPITSPSAVHLPENRPHTSPKGKDTSTGFALFYPKSQPASPPPPAVQKCSTDVPHLSLNLPAPTEQRSRALRVVFEVNPGALDESVIGERRLSPLETLVLVRACSQVIVERGLESLGIMHPHWYSASPDVQRRLISLYIHSLAPNSSPTTLSSTSAASDSAFQSELAYVRSPHDVAAVLRWGLRHLQLDGDAFGTDTAESAEWAWYTAFADAERAAGYPPDAFSQTLMPQLPPAHGELLFATLEIISSLAAYGEATGSSGSKLSKFLGLWLLTARRSAENDDWNAFYDRWERAGRILEHLFLSRIRDEAVYQRVPRRLTELVDRYPYNQGSSTTDGLLTRPRFSTRSYKAIFVHIESEYTGASKPQAHPLRIIAEALRSVVSPEDSDLTSVWDNIKTASLSSEQEDSFPIFSKVFTDETIRLLSLIPADTPDKDLSPTFALLTPVTRAIPLRRRSFSLPGTPVISSQNKNTNGHASSSSQGHATVAKTPTITTGAGTAPTTASPETPTDWAQFTNLGFTTTPGPRDLASTLWDTDIEITSPPDTPLPLSRKSSRKRRSLDVHSYRSSVDNPATSPPRPPPPPPPPTSKVVRLQRIRIDEAFVDFWSDALLDPIAASWGKFVLCQLKPLLALQAEAPAWLVIEQTFVRPPPVSAPAPAAAVEAELAARASVKSEGPRISSTFSLLKRFSFFSHSQDEKEKENGAEKKRARKLPRVGEMGEILAEERSKSKSPEPESKAVEERGRPPVEGKEETVVESVGVAAGTAAVAAAGAAVAAAAAVQLKEEVEGGSTAAPPATVDAPVAEDSASPAAAVPADTDGDVLPAAPKTVVLAGETPGPQVALQKSEPVAVAQAAADETSPVMVQEAEQDTPTEPIKEPETVEAAKEAEASVVPVAEVAAPIVEESHPSQETIIVEETPAQDVAQPPVVERTVEEPVLLEPSAVDVEQPALAAEETITVVKPTPTPSINVAPSVVEEPVHAEPPAEVPVAALEPQPLDKAAPVATEQVPAVIVEEAPVPEPSAPVGEPVIASEPLVAVEEPSVIEEPAAPVEEPSAVPEPVAEEPPAVLAAAEETITAEEPTAAAEQAPLAEELPAVEEPSVAEPVSAVAEEAPAIVEELAVVPEPTPTVEESSAVNEPSVEQSVASAVEEPAQVDAVSEEPAAAEPPVPTEERIQVANVVQEEEQPASEPKESTPVAELVLEEPSVIAEPTPVAEPAVEVSTVEVSAPVAELLVEEALAVEEAPAVEAPVSEEIPVIEEPTPAPVESIIDEAPKEVAPEFEAANEPTPAAPEPVVKEAPPVKELTRAPVEAVLEVPAVEESIPAAPEPVVEEPMPAPAKSVVEESPAAEDVPQPQMEEASVTT